MPKNLSSGDLHIMGLMRRDAGLNGWCKTSKPVMRLVMLLPPELVEYEVFEDGSGSSRLKPLGLSILIAREWL